MTNINLHIIEDCKSTNSSLIKLANEGYPEGYSLLSINQTCGKGTRKRKWVSIPGNLFLSTLIRPNVEPMKLSQISIIFGLSLFQFIKSLGIIAIELIPIFFNSLVVVTSFVIIALT